MTVRASDLHLESLHNSSRPHPFAAFLAPSPNLHGMSSQPPGTTKGQTVLTDHLCTAQYKQRLRLEVGQLKIHFAAVFTVHVLVAVLKEKTKFCTLTCNLVLSAFSYFLSV